MPPLRCARQCRSSFNRLDHPSSTLSPTTCPSLMTYSTRDRPFKPAADADKGVAMLLNFGRAATTAEVMTGGGRKVSIQLKPLEDSGIPRNGWMSGP